MTPRSAVDAATMLLPHLIAADFKDVIGLRVASGAQEKIIGPINEWLRKPDAVAIDMRTPGEAVIAHQGVMCRMRYARDLVDFTVSELVVDGPAMHDVAAALEHFAKEHRP